MHNLFISQLRRKRVRRRVEPLSDNTDVEPSVRASQEDRLYWRDLVLALNSLSEEQRTVVRLVTVENLSCADVARVLGIPIGTVMSRLARGRERLRQLTDTDARPALRRVQGTSCNGRSRKRICTLMSTTCSTRRAGRLLATTWK